MTDNKLNIKSYAIFIRGSYGDLLMTDPLIKLIKGLNLNNKITLFVDENNYQLVQFMENIDSFIKMPSKGNRYLFFMYFGLKNRKNKYDVSIAAKTGVGSENGFFQFMLGAKKQISYISRKKSWTDRLINSPIIFEEDLYHKQHYALGVLQLLDAKFKTIPKPLLPKLKTNIKKTKTKHVKILISTSNNRVYSQLDIEKIAEIINQICGEFQLKIYISCMEKDKEIAHKLNQLITHPSKTYSTRTFIDFIKLINSMDLCLLGDGGIMHIAAALDISQVVLFGKTSPVTWAPLNDKATILYDKFNVNNIPMNLVIDALRKNLNELN